MAAPVDSLPAVQATARAVQEWGKMFGHELQLARNKTAFLHLPQPTAIERFYQHANRVPVTEALPTITPNITLSDGTVVPLTLEYKYLGYWLRSELPEDAHLQQAIAYIGRNHARYFAYNGITRNICFLLFSLV